MEIKSAAVGIAAAFCLGLTGCAATAELDPNAAVCDEFSAADDALISALSDWTGSLPAKSHWNEIDGVSPELFAQSEDAPGIWDELYLRAEGDVKERIKPLLSQFADEQDVIRISDSDLIYFDEYDAVRESIASACKIDSVAIALNDSWVPVSLTNPDNLDN